MPFGSFILFTIGSSFILSWILYISGNKPFAGIYAHGLSNALIPVIPALKMKLDVPQPRYWIWVFLTIISGILLFMTIRLLTNENDGMCLLHGLSF